MPYDEGLEEIWRIKREIAAEYPTLEAYFKGMLEYQNELKRQGVKFVRLPPLTREPYPAVSVPPLSVAEEGAAYAKPKESAPPPSKTIVRPVLAARPRGEDSRT